MRRGGLGHSRLAVACAVGVALVLRAADVRGGDRPAAPPLVLPPDAAEALGALAHPYRLDGPVGGGWTWRGLALDGAAATFVLERGRELATLRLTHAAAGEEGRFCGRIRLQPTAASPAGADALAALAAPICAAAAAAGGDAPFRAVTPPPEAADGDSAAPVAADVAGIRGALSGLWAALLALLAWHGGAVVRRRRPAPRSDRRYSAALVALGALALGLRVALAPWGPGDFQVNLVDALLPTDGPVRHGLAPAALLRPLLALFEPTVDTLIAVNLAAGALAPLVAVALARAVGRGRADSLLVGMVLACQPVLVRFSGVANRQSLAVLLALVALWATARQAAGPGSHRLLAVSAVATFLALQTRPEALLLLPLLPLLALAAAPGALAARLRPAGTALALVCLAFALWWPLRETTIRSVTDHDWLSPALLTLRADVLDPTAHIWLQPAYTPLAVLVCGALGVLHALAHRDPVALWAIAALLLFAHVGSAWPVLAPELFSARYQTLALVPAALLASYGVAGIAAVVERSPRRRAGPAVAVVATAVILVSAVPPLCVLAAPTALDRELDVLRRHAPRLPAGAVVYTVPVDDVHGSRNLVGTAAALFALPQEWRALDPARPPAPAGDAFYYHPLACHHPDLDEQHRAACRFGERHLAVRSVAVVDLPNDGASDFMRSAAPTWRVGFYALGP